jgi:hypothetical protein
VDVITTVPFDAIVLAALRLPEGFTSRYVALLGLLKLGRMYRVGVMFRNMSYNLNMGLLALTLLRNFTVRLAPGFNGNSTVQALSVFILICLRNFMVRNLPPHNEPPPPSPPAPLWRRQVLHLCNSVTTLCSHQLCIIRNVMVRPGLVRRRAPHILAYSYMCVLCAIKIVSLMKPASQPSIAAIDSAPDIFLVKNVGMLPTLLPVAFACCCCRQLCVFLLHWAACGFWYIALQEGQHEMTWVGQEADIINGRSTIDL